MCKNSDPNRKEKKKQLNSESQNGYNNLGSVKIDSMHISLINLLHLFGHQKKTNLKKIQSHKKNSASIANEFNPGFCMITYLPNTRTENTALLIFGAKGRMYSTLKQQG